MLSPAGSTVLMLHWDRFLAIVLMPFHCNSFFLYCQVPSVPLCRRQVEQNTLRNELWFFKQATVTEWPRIISLSLRGKCNSTEYQQHIRAWHNRLALTWNYVQYLSSSTGPFADTAGHIITACLEFQARHFLEVSIWKTQLYQVIFQIGKGFKASALASLSLFYLMKYCQQNW